MVKRKVSKRKAPTQRVKVKAGTRRVSQAKLVGKATRQTGTSNRNVDKTRVALKAGRRQTTNPHYHRGKLITKTTRYSENRRNRSDKNPTKKL